MEPHPLRRRVEISPPPVAPTARHFCNREVGVLAEQGVLDRARMLLARRARDEPLVPDAFLDAIRLELTVPSSGSAWQAWLARALEGGVEIADRIAAIVPEPELSRALGELPPALLLRQASRADALDLLRSRAATLLGDGDGRALDLLEGELCAVSAHDSELRDLQVAILLARAFASPDLVERHGRAVASSVTAEQAAALQRELELARIYHRLGLAGQLPPLDAALALLGRCHAELDRALRSNLSRDVRARPSDYLAWADAVASAEPVLLDALLARFVGTGASAPSNLARRCTQLTTELAGSIGRDALRFVPLSSSELSLYRKYVRLKALTAIAEQAVTFDALAGVLREHKGAARRALAHFEADAALRLVDRIAQATT